MSVILTDKLLY